MLWTEPRPGWILGQNKSWEYLYMGHRIAVIPILTKPNWGYQLIQRPAFIPENFYFPIRISIYWAKKSKLSDKMLDIGWGIFKDPVSAMEIGEKVLCLLVEGNQSWVKSKYLSLEGPARSWGEIE